MTVAVDVEITAFMRCLEQERDHVLGAVEGLSDEALRRPALPSGWNCLGMVQHLTLSVERLYYRHEAFLADAVIAASSPDADVA